MSAGRLLAQALSLEPQFKAGTGGARGATGAFPAAWLDLLVRTRAFDPSRQLSKLSAEWPLHPTLATRAQC